MLTLHCLHKCAPFARNNRSRPWDSIGCDARSRCSRLVASHRRETYCISLASDSDLLDTHRFSIRLLNCNNRP